MGRAKTAGTTGTNRGQRRSSGSARPVRAAAARTATRTGSATAPPGSGLPGKGNDGAAGTAGGTAARPRAGAPVAVPPTWVRLTALILSLGGLAVSVYLTIVHYSTAVSLACPNTGTVNCEKVITSPESVVFGIPVAVLGLPFFVFMVAVNSPPAWRAPLRQVHVARLASVIAGMCFVIYLIYVELFEVGAICLWCTSVHAITFALFVLVVFSAAAWGIPDAGARSG